MDHEVTEPQLPLTAARQEDAKNTWFSDGLGVMVGGVAAIAVALLLPWMTATAAFAGEIDRSGLDTGDGRFVGVLVLLAGWLLYREAAAPDQRLRMAIGLVLAMVTVALVYDFVDITDRIDEVNDSELATGEVGSGLYLAVIGAVAALGAWVVRLRKLRKP